MLSVTLDEKSAIAILEPQGALEKEDFDAAVKLIDPFIEEHGRLNGIIISTESFPGWKSFSALSRHLTFIKNHHKKIKRLAFVTNSVIGNIAENMTGHFVEAGIKTFPYGEMEKAKAWILEEA
jgi:hypothetical protein